MAKGDLNLGWVQRCRAALAPPPSDDCDPAVVRVCCTRARADHGVQGRAVHPILRGMRADDRMARPLCEAIAETGAPALVRTGRTGAGPRPV
jgi:hypothetical protein